MNVRAPLAALMLLTLAPAAARAEEGAYEIRRFPLHHVEVKEANAIVRSLLDVRKTAVDMDRNTLLLGDHRAKLDEAERILRELDVAPGRWQARLVARTSAGDLALRTMPLSDLATWSTGSTTIGDRITLRARPHAIGSRLSLDLEVEAAAGGNAAGSQSFQRRTTERYATADGDAIEVLLVEPPEAQAAVAALVGSAHPVRTLRLEIERVDEAGGPRKGRRAGLAR